MKYLYLLFFIPSLVSAQGDWLDIKEAQVLTPEKKSQGKTKAQKEQQLIDSFTRHYIQQGKPSIAILWNRRFADVFSQWQADTRQSNEIIMSGRPANGAAKSSNSNNNVNCSWYLKSNSNGDCTYINRSYSETRITDDPERNSVEHSSELEESKFNSGYAQAFLSAGAHVIDRATIMRLVEREQRSKSGSSVAPDYYRIEADALIGHADYLAEVLLAGADYSNPGVDTYSVSIKDVKTGRILAMLHTDGLAFSSDKVEPTWAASTDGYELSDNELNDKPEIHNLGRAVALETMQALNRIWGR